MKKAFTMIELVFVIVVIGILAAVIIPNTRTNPVQEAAIKLNSDIRYVQHLAMVDDKYDAADVNWHKNRWQIAFNGTQYSLVSNNNARFALDPQTQKNMQNIDLAAKYGISSITYSGGCNVETDISFDSMGRPMIGDLNTLPSAHANGYILTTPCVIGITDGTEDANISISPETGYSRIL